MGFGIDLPENGRTLYGSTHYATNKYRPGYHDRSQIILFIDNWCIPDGMRPAYWLQGPNLDGSMVGHTL